MKKTCYQMLLALIFVLATSMKPAMVKGGSGSSVLPGRFVGVSLPSNGMATQDLSVPEAASLSYAPPTLETKIQRGTSTTLQLTLTNNGDGAATFELQEEPGGYTPNPTLAQPESPQTAAPSNPEARHAPGIAAQQVPNRTPTSNLSASTTLIYEGFEGGVVPPSGWSEEVANRSYNWDIAIFGIPHSGDFAANVEYDDKNQDEWLLSPEMDLTQATLSFWSQGSIYWCRDTYDNCDLKIWIVVGDVGGGDDIYLGEADGDWPTSWTWAQSTFDLTSFLPGGPVRIGFEYIGNDGAQILLDDILLDGTPVNPDISWLSESPISGTISAAQSQTIDVTFDASQVSQSGFYSGTLHILSNDSLNPDQSVPVVMQVTDQPVVTLVTPNHGPASGGTAVTISGSNFKSGAWVAFGAAEANDVVVVSGEQITCTTPAHFPEMVDVQVTNSDDQSGTLLRGYTYDSDPVLMSLPQASGGQNETVQVPVNLANVQDLAAASFTVTFDHNILHATGAESGSLTPGWSLAANTDNPGEVRISMASSGGMVSGTGVLAMIDFEVVGTPGSSSELGLSSVLLNDGAIPVQTASGSFSVNLVYRVSGTIQFWNGGVVSDTMLTLNGESTYHAQSGVDGTFQFSGVAAGDYTLTPEMSNESGGIYAYDASLVLQHDAGLITLSGHAATAADVNKNGAINSMDAFYILQKSVDLISLPFPGAGAVWSFSPPSRSYTGLGSDLTGQDFQAILLGDPSGNWAPAGFSQMTSTLNFPETVSATLSLPSVNVLPGETFTVPVSIDLASGQVFGADIEIAYDANVLTPTQVLQGALATGWSIASNLNNPGLIHVAMAGATPIVANGELLQVEFTATDQAGVGTDLSLTKGELNEENVNVVLQSGHVNIAVPVQANFSATPSSGPAPLHVTFSNQSSGDFTTSLWNFGDGSSSTSTSPSHDYSLPGIYTVTLSVSGPGGSHSLVRSNYINAYGLRVSGRAQYWAGNLELPGVGLNLNGEDNYSSSSDVSGLFTISNILAGSYSLVPGKADDAAGITAFDASLVLQHVAGLSNLAGYPAAAADVNDSGSVGTMDASYILQKAVGLIELPFPGAASVWEFDPLIRSYVDLHTDQTGQDFTGILLGDPSGNWGSGGSSPALMVQQTLAKLSIQGSQPDPNGYVTATIHLDPAGAQLYSLDLKLNFDPAQAQIVGVETGPLLEGWMMAKNVQHPGEIRVSLASAQPVSDKGIVLSLVFKMNGASSSPQINFDEGLLNEGNIPVELEGVQPDGISVFLPSITR